MKTSRVLALGSAGLLAACMIGLSPPALANVVAAGMSASPDVLAFGSGTQVASTSGTFTSVLGAGDFSGSYAEMVYSDPANTFGAGDLTWYIEIGNDASSGNALEAVSTSSFSGVMTDVGYTTSVAGVMPTTVSRGPSGSTVNFLFPSPSTIAPGDNTVWLTIMTDATHYGPGHLSVINEGSATVSAFAPAVPEPSTWAMMLLGFAGLGFAGFRKPRGDRLAA